MKNDNSSVLTSNVSKELKKNVSSLDFLPKIKFYKYRNNSTILPSSIIKVDNEGNSASKKGSTITRSNYSKMLNSDGISNHISFIE